MGDLYEVHKKRTNFLAICAGGSDLKKRVPFVTMLTTSEHRPRCDWIVTVLAGKTKFLAAGLKKEFPAVQEFGYFYFSDSMPVSFCSGHNHADFCMVLRQEGHTLPGKRDGGGDLLIQYKA